MSRLAVAGQPGFVDARSRGRRCARQRCWATTTCRAGSPAVQRSGRPRWRRRIAGAHSVPTIDADGRRPAHGGFDIGADETQALPFPAADPAPSASNLFSTAGRDANLPGGRDHTGCSSAERALRRGIGAGHTVNVRPGRGNRRPGRWASGSIYLEPGRVRCATRRPISPSSMSSATRTRQDLLLQVQRSHRTDATWTRQPVDRGDATTPRSGNTCRYRPGAGGNGDGAYELPFGAAAVRAPATCLARAAAEWRPRSTVFQNGRTIGTST